MGVDQQEVVGSTVMLLGSLAVANTCQPPRTEPADHMTGAERSTKTMPATRAPAD